MAQFPRREAEILALARALAAGLAANPDLFPNPPVSPEELLAAVEKAEALCANASASRAKAQEDTALKRSGLGDLTDKAKTNLRYTEIVARGDDAILAKVDWSVPAPPTPLQPPGQPGELTAPERGPGWVRLEWRKPEHGGKVVTYIIERRQFPSGAWTLVDGTMERYAVIVNQEPGIEYEYRIIAANHAGQSPASNTVTAAG